MVTRVSPVVVVVVLVVASFRLAPTWMALSALKAVIVVEEFVLATTKVLE